jgi:hypothetical protein
MQKIAKYFGSSTKSLSQKDLRIKQQTLSPRPSGWLLMNEPT